MHAVLRIPVTHFQVAGWRRGNGPAGKHAVHAGAPACGGTPPAARMASTDPDIPTPVALTGRQKVALMLAKAGYSHAVIAEKMGLRHRQTATQLIARARTAEKAFRAAVIDFISSS